MPFHLPWLLDVSLDLYELIISVIRIYKVLIYFNCLDQIYVQPDTCLGSQNNKKKNYRYPGYVSHIVQCVGGGKRWQLLCTSQLFLTPQQWTVPWSIHKRKVMFLFLKAQAQLEHVIKSLWWIVSHDVHFIRINNNMLYKQYII